MLTAARIDRLYIPHAHAKHVIVSIINIPFEELQSDWSRRYSGGGTNPSIGLTPDFPFFRAKSGHAQLAFNVILRDAHHWGEPERGPHDAVYGDFVCLSVMLSVCTSTFRIYSCSNSTITHAQNLCAIFSSHIVCTCSY